MNHRLLYFVKLARTRVGLSALARPCVAVAVSYALALQILLASVMAAGMAMGAPADDAVICYGSGKTSGGADQPSHSPAGSADCILACAQGLNAAAILPPDIALARIFTFGRELEQAPATAFILSPLPSPKLAQGPPQNA
jgi:hypothetical protein